jgi:hypothetical protein
MTQPQHMQALKKANDIRFRRADDKRRIAEATGPRSYHVVADLIERAPEHLGRVPMLTLAKWPKRMGAFRAERLLADHSITPGRLLGQLTLRQRQALAASLRVMSGEYGATEATGPECPTCFRPGCTMVHVDPPAGAWNGRCAECRDPLRHRSVSGLCGFCLEEKGMAA